MLAGGDDDRVDHGAMAFHRLDDGRHLDRLGPGPDHEDDPLQAHSFVYAHRAARPFAHNTGASAAEFISVAIFLPAQQTNKPSGVVISS